MSTTTQEAFWSGEFGKAYSDRNNWTSAQYDDFYRHEWGITKTQMNEDCPRDLPKDAKILEVGCNIGLQLRCLQEMGFTNLYGIELQHYAVEKAKEIVKNVNIIQGSGFDIPFKDSYFDVVVTNGVLIHIAPDDLPRIMSEMVRCSKKYVWGFEYFASSLVNINYRGNEGFLWKADYSKIFQENFPQLQEIYRKMYPYVSASQQGNVDYMYLLEKQ